MAFRIAIVGSLLAASALVTWGCSEQPGRIGEVKDEAMLAGMKASDFKAADDNYFADMDYGYRGEGFDRWFFRMITNNRIDMARRAKVRRAESLDTAWTGDDGETHGLPVRERRTFRNWRHIGKIVFQDAVASYNGDFVIHFHHPTWRDDQNDPATGTRVNERKVRWR